MSLSVDQQRIVERYELARAVIDAISHERPTIEQVLQLMLVEELHDTNAWLAVIRDQLQRIG